MKENMKKGYLYSVFMSLIMGLQYVFIKNLIDIAYGRIFFVLFLRFFLSFLIFLVFFALREKKTHFPLLKEKRLFSLSLLHPVVNFTFQSLAVIKLPVLAVSILIAFIPIINALMGHFLLGEGIAKRQWILIFLCATGSILLSLKGFKGLDGDFYFLGVAFLIISIISRGLYSVKARRLSKGFSPGEITFCQLFWGCIIYGFFFAVSLFFTESVDYIKVISKGEFIWGIIYLSILATCFVFYFNNYALRHISVGNMGLLNSLTALVSALAAVLILGEDLSIYMIFGFIIVSISNYLYPKFKEQI